MKLIGVYRKCDFVTMSGTSFAICGILSVINHKGLFAICFLMLAAICDAFDGVVARKGNSTKEEQTYGVELDSLSDAISFGVLQMLIALNYSCHSVITYIVCVFFCLCGIIRLAYFNMLSINKKSNGKEFIGLPITASAIIIPVVYFIVKIFKLFKYGYIIFPVTLLITAVLYICPFKLRKPTSREKGLLSILGLLVIVLSVIKISKVG